MGGGEEQGRAYREGDRSLILFFKVNGLPAS